jgi:hypothetical protein
MPRVGQNGDLLPRLRHRAALLRRQRHELADPLLIRAVLRALAAKALRLCRWNAGDTPDRAEDHGLAEQREEAPRREREAVDRVADPDAPLEEVILPDDLSVENRSRLRWSKHHK